MSERRCYFCHQVALNEATYAGICTRHRIQVSLRLLFLAARSHTSQAAQDREVVAMTQLLTTPAATSSQFAPEYRNDLARTIGIFQQLQVLCASDDASLADVMRAVRAMQHEFGENAPLENVIQALVGQHIRQQLAARRQQHHLETMEVLQ